jgi:hypothetical protein
MMRTLEHDDEFSTETAVRPLAPQADETLIASNGYRLVSEGFESDAHRVGLHGDRGRKGGDVALATPERYAGNGHDES